jgi:hypothetical protein
MAVALVETPAPRAGEVREVGEHGNEKYQSSDVTAEIAIAIGKNREEDAHTREESRAREETG